MTVEVLMTALGLVLIVEGLLPFVAPSRWRELFTQVLQLKDGQIRFIGLGALVLGALLILF